ncbi:hypothetical protein CGRA01v4_13111 [Colletotrichum graminicola]|nr:hypothetical protein CGRA01v4_13111 [Colletotrichum graminicola]
MALTWHIGSFRQLPGPLLSFSFHFLSNRVRHCLWAAQGGVLRRCIEGQGGSTSAKKMSMTHTDPLAGKSYTLPQVFILLPFSFRSSFFFFASHSNSTWIPSFSV